MLSAMTDIFLYFPLICMICTFTFHTTNSDELNIPANHLPYYFFNYPAELKKCLKKGDCPYKDVQPLCWGYEPGCTIENSFKQPTCTGDHKGWVKSKKEQLETFYSQADFGFVRTQRDTIEVICEPTFKVDSVLECSEHLQLCRGRNIFLNLTRLRQFGPWRYRMDILQPGDISGFCIPHLERLEKRSDRMSALQSWGPELANFRILPRALKPETDCDIFIEKPTFILKIDAAVNMYHHLCDFLNLYASLHVNSSHPSFFSTDVDMIIWETYPYRSAFSDLWSAFTQNPVKTLDAFEGKTVCFKNLVLPLLPRMIFGLYYNTPLVYGCEGSGLFKAFSQHVLHRLKIEDPPLNDSLRVTFLSRETNHRNVVNEEDLLLALASEPNVSVQRVVFNSKMPFRRQLTVIRATDVFISMHGAGLTHLLFLPDWAAVFELYNCEDESCYYDLARLRGVKYATWEDKDKLKRHGMAKHPDGGTHAKFADYSFDVSEFLRIFRNLASHVRDNKMSTPPNKHDEL